MAVALEDKTSPADQKSISTIPTTPIVPFSEPPWLNGMPSPYYNESHRRFQKYARKFINENLNDHALDWEREEFVPEWVFKKFSAVGMLIPNLPSPLPVKLLKDSGIHQIGEGEGAVKVEDWDYIHTMVYLGEMNRSGINGPQSSMTVGIAFGAPPIFKFGSPELQKRILPDVLTGRKRICIAITEPDAGSDVANIQTTGVKSKDGKHYIINGTKKWITNGIWSDYAAMAVRTGSQGPGGLSMIVVPLKGHPGVEMRRLHVQGQHTAGTTYIELDDVKVPVENLIGQEGSGMNYIMTNFNHERLVISIGVATQARTAVSAAMAYVMQRNAFGQPLINQPVVRNRLARAGAELESLWSWVESFVYSMTKLPKEVADVELGGLTALCKAKAGMVLNECSQCAQLLFGGNGYTKSGKGELVERISREVFGARVPGGSEDVMLDLAVRQLVKIYERKMKASSKL